MSHLRSGLERCGIEYFPINEPARHKTFNGDALLIQFPDQVFWRSREKSFSKLIELTNRQLTALAYIKARLLSLFGLSIT